MWRRWAQRRLCFGTRGATPAGGRAPRKTPTRLPAQPQRHGCHMSAEHCPGGTGPRGDADMTGPRLPDGFAVQVDRRVKVLGEGSALLGGSPTRLLRLAPAAQTMLDGVRLEVHDAVSAQLARTLLDATVAHPRPATGPSHRDVTVVISAGDNVFGLLRLVGPARGMRVVVVDDGSAQPVYRSDFADMHCDIQVLRHTRSKGPA